VSPCDQLPRLRVRLLLLLLLLLLLTQTLPSHAPRAVHGNELNGIPIIHRLFRELDCSTLCGIVVAVPVVNVHGYTRFSRGFSDGCATPCEVLVPPSFPDALPAPRSQC